MDTTTTIGAHPEEPSVEISRADTGLRILLTLGYSLVYGLVESLMALIVLFELVWTFVTKDAPPARARAIANHLIAYGYRIGRYLSYNDDRVPFPFDDFPEDLEPTSWTGELHAREAMGLGQRRPGEVVATSWDEEEDGEG